MSKRELKEKKLDTKILWGVVATGSLAVAGWLLVRHKVKKKEDERAEELEARTDSRLVSIGERIQQLTTQLQQTDDVTARDSIAELIGQAKLYGQLLESERKLPLKLRLAWEEIHEAEAHLEQRLERRHSG